MFNTGLVSVISTNMSTASGDSDVQHRPGVSISTNMSTGDSLMHLETVMFNTGLVSVSAQT